VSGTGFVDPDLVAIGTAFGCRAMRLDAVLPGR
jgi:hypothetical protein